MTDSTVNVEIIMNIDVTAKIKRWLGVSDAERFAEAHCPAFAKDSAGGLSSAVRRPSSDFSGLQPTAYSLQPALSSGIALVMVLGILSVMVLMAVAFAIAMRTERVAAGNYADSVRARQLVQVGLARALGDLALRLGTNGLESTSVGSVYPLWSVTNSYTNVYTNTSTNVYALQLLATNRANDATNFVPRALWAAATNADYSNPSNHWLPVDSLIYTKDGAADFLAESNRMGRVKYLILNCSGLLDANFAGGMVHGMGTNPMEIMIANLPEMKNYPTFINNRSTHFRYDTQAELDELNKNEFYGASSNFTVYSRALPGYWNNIAPVGVGTSVNLSGSVVDLAISNRISAITNAFVLAGFGQDDAGMLYSNLMDYVDSDLVPSNFESCVESVPMINEVVVSNSVEVLPGSIAANRSYKIITDVYVECWYPFVKSVTAVFSLDVAAKFSGSPGFEHPDSSGSVPSLASAAGGAPIKYLCFHLEKGPFELTMMNPVTLTTTIDPKVLQSSDTVDKLKNPIVLTTTHDGNATGVGPDNKAASFECLDPRFNYDPSSAQKWRTRAIAPSNAPLADINPWVTEWWSTNASGDVDSEMYVANDRLHSVAELGCLVYTNMPWKTVKLYGPNLHRVLDVFGLSTNASDVLMTNTVFHGLVNCNSNSALDATAVVFADMPIDKYPGEGGNTLKMPAAQTFASEIFGSGVFTNLSDVGRKLDQGDFTLAATELQKEAYFRNAVNLLNLRQNLFTIIIEAHVASGGNIPRNPVKQRAAALVWRDPYTGEMFVRSIKWLED